MKQVFYLFPIFAVAACGSGMTDADRESFRKADVNGDRLLSLTEANDFELARVFKDVDTNKDGRVSFAEAREIHPDFRWKQFQEYDRNGDGMVTYEEFFLVQTKKGTVTARFNATDTNGDGMVTPKEAKERAKRLMNEAQGAW